MRHYYYIIIRKFPRALGTIPTKLEVPRNTDVYFHNSIVLEINHPQAADLKPLLLPHEEQFQAEMTLTQAGQAGGIGPTREMGHRSSMQEVCGRRCVVGMSPTLCPSKASVNSCT